MAINVCPPSFRETAKQEMLSWTTFERQMLLSEESRERFEAARKVPARFDTPQELRGALLDFIADFSSWSNSAVPEFVATAQALTLAAHEALGGEAGTRPLVVDPFAGGGSIPLEALRVGADAFATDLNPIPVLLNKLTLEFVPKYGSRLAAQVRERGEWIKREAEQRLSEFYPVGGDGATPIAYLWARTILSEAPSVDQVPVQIPLLRTMWLSKRKEFRRAIRWVRDARGKVKVEEIEIEFEEQKIKVRRPILEIFSPAISVDVEAGTAKGGAATCPVTGFTTSASRVKEQLKQQRGGAQQSRMYAVYTAHPSGRREFRAVSKSDAEAYAKATLAASKIALENPSVFPQELINPIRPFKNTRGLSAVTRIGCEAFADLYNPRQLLALHVFYGALEKLSHENLSSDSEFSKALQTALAFAINRGASQNTSMSRWDASRLTIKGAFSKQALAVVWDFAEANPFSDGSANWDGAIEWVDKFIETNASIKTPGTIVRASATLLPLPADSAAALVTDPPYFSAIPYADLSDFFYVWFKRGLSKLYPELFNSELTEKVDELIVTNAQQGRDGRVKDDLFFREGMAAALKSARDAVQKNGIGVVVYAEGTTAGWEAILGAIVDSQWVVTASWPIDTEMDSRTQAQGSASLQSSVHIVCRPREDVSQSVTTIGDWRDVLAELPRRIHDWMPRLASEGVAGADAIFACLGPALEIFSRYSSVEKASGESVTLKEYLEHVWAAVAKEALAQVFKDADTTGFEPDALITAMWLWTLTGGAPAEVSIEKEDADDEEEDGETTTAKKIKPKGFALEFDAARKIAQGLGAALEDLTSIIEVKGDSARLLPVSERAAFLFGKDSAHAPAVEKKKKDKQLKLGLFDELMDEDQKEVAWKEKAKAKLGETTLDRVHQSMILFAAGRGEAMKRFLVDDGAGQDQRFWKLAQALSALYPSSTDEKRWVDGVLARKRGLGL